MRSCHFTPHDANTVQTLLTGYESLAENNTGNVRLRHVILARPTLLFRLVNVGATLAQVEVGLSSIVDTVEFEEGSIFVLITFTASEASEDCFDIEAEGKET